MKIYTSCNYIVGEQTHNGLSALSWVISYQLVTFYYDLSSQLQGPLSSNSSKVAESFFGWCPVAPTAWLWMAAGKDGLTKHKDKKQETDSNYRTRKHLTKLTEETQQHADKQNTVQSERLRNEVSK